MCKGAILLGWILFPICSESFSPACAHYSFASVLPLTQVNSSFARSGKWIQQLVCQAHWISVIVFCHSRKQYRSVAGRSYDAASSLQRGASGVYNFPILLSFRIWLVNYQGPPKTLMYLRRDRAANHCTSPVQDNQQQMSENKKKTHSIPHSIPPHSPRNVPHNSSNRSRL